MLKVDKIDVFGRSKNHEAHVFVRFRFDADGLARLGRMIQKYLPDEDMYLLVSHPMDYSNDSRAVFVTGLRIFTYKVTHKALARRLRFHHMMGRLTRIRLL